jgi:hypothetical protein
MPLLIRTRALPFLLLLVCLAFVGFALGQTPQKYDSTIVRFKSRDCPNKDNFAGTSVSIGGAKAVSDASKGGDVLVDLGPADYMVSNLTEPGQPNAKLVAVRVLLGNTLIREYPANENGMANIALEENIFGHTDARQVIDVITANDCDTGTGPTVESTPEEKKVDVILKSLECDKGNYKSYTVYLNDQTVTPNGEDVANNVPLKSGRYSVKVSVPDFPETKVASISIYRPSREVYFRKEANSSGAVEDFILEDDLWDGATSTKIPGIFIYTAGDCTTAYEPPMQRLGGSPQIRVSAVEGRVTIFKDGNSAAESQLVKGSIIEDEQVVYTRPGARVELIASDKRLFILGGKTVVKFVIKKGSDGTWGISADIRAAEQFTVRHVGYVKGEGGYVWKVLTPTATVTEKGTIYDVTFDESSKVTTVGVEQGQVLVTPSSSSLKPFTLDEHQKADVFENRVSAIAPYSGADNKTGGGFFGSTLIWVSVGVAGLFVFLILPIGGYIIYRVLWRTPPTKPAYTPTGHKAHSSTPYRAPSKGASRTPSRNASAGVRCPNPKCRRAARPGKEFCNSCGTSLR